MKRTEGDREGGKRAARRDSIHQTRLVNERSNNRNCASNRLIRVENTRVLLPAINRPDYRHFSFFLFFFFFRKFSKGPFSSKVKGSSLSPTFRENREEIVCRNSSLIEKRKGRKSWGRLAPFFINRLERRRKSERRGGGGTRAMPLGGSLFVKQSMAKCQPHTCLLPTIDTIEISSAQIRGFARLSRFLSLSLSLS